MYMYEAIKNLNEIITLQSRIIDRLFILLIQYIEVEDIEKEIGMMRKAAQAQSGTEGGCTIVGGN